MDVLPRQTTLKERLASSLKVPSVSLDTVMWQPGWNELPKEEFRSRITLFIEQNESWIIDGNYNGYVGDLTAAAATDIICMYYHGNFHYSLTKHMSVQRARLPLLFVLPKPTFAHSSTIAPNLRTLQSRVRRKHQ